MRPYRWTTSWGDHLNTQADALRNTIASVQLPDTTLIIGHSNGGLIARHASYNRPFRAILTIGTLHTGAPLAESVQNGSVAFYGAFVYNVGATAYYDYDFPDCCEDWWDNELYFARTAASDLGSLGLIITGAADYFVSTAFNVLTDMRPGSGFLSELNGSERLSHEAQTIPYRVGARSNLQSSNFLIWEALAPDNAWGLSGLTYVLMDRFWYAYDYYSTYYHPADPNEYWKQYYSSDWLYALGTLQGLQYSWCSFIGALDGQYCAPSDAVVPFDRQTYPGATDPPIDLSPGPSHSRQTTSGDFQSRARDYLRDIVGVPTATQPSVYIDGPNPSQPGVYTYYAIASGAFGNYQYRWYRSYNGSDYIDTGFTTSSYTLTLYPGANWIRVVVTSGDLQQSAVRQVNIP